MFYTYVLLSEKDQKLYMGYTENLRNRLALHQAGLVPSTATRRPVRLIFYEAYPNKYDALRRERYIKTDKGKTTLKSMLREFLSKSESNYPKAHQPTL